MGEKNKTVILFPLPEYLKTNKQESKAKQSTPCSEGTWAFLTTCETLCILSWQNVLEEAEPSILCDFVMIGAGPRRAVQVFATEALKSSLLIWIFIL